MVQVGPTVAFRFLVTVLDVFPHSRRQLAKVFHELPESLLAFVPRNSKLSKAFLVSSFAKPSSRNPNARVQAGKHTDKNTLGKFNTFTSSNRNHLRFRNTFVGHDPDRLVGSNNRCSCVLGDPLRSICVVKMRVPYENVICLGDVLRKQ